MSEIKHQIEFNSQRTQIRAYVSIVGRQQAGLLWSGLETHPTHACSHEILSKFQVQFTWPCQQPAPCQDLLTHVLFSALPRKWNLAVSLTVIAILPCNDNREQVQLLYKLS